VNETEYWPSQNKGYNILTESGGAKVKLQTAAFMICVWMIAKLEWANPHVNADIAVRQVRFSSHPIG
jgi:hypothetical protein